MPVQFVIAKEVITRLVERKQTIATCESLTAGLCAATFADVPGASAVLRGGLITYATELKHSLAGVPKDLLARYGPVSEKTAIAMAVGTRTVCSADWGLALTGVAGPDSQDGHPVGEVWLGLARPDGTATAVLAAKVLKLGEVLLGDRAEIRTLAVQAALELINSELG